MDADELYRDDDDLYEDLVTSDGDKGKLLLQEQNTQLMEELKEANSQNASMKMRISELEGQVASVSKERDTLIRNISCIYKTAKREIQRKDATVAELRHKMQRHG
mmetsp:Transcript_4461/g.8374  ORF Transcript_4461/g.8374 Transcript_4461/m.8374 type:complete len:105 (-) Transcript_4461:195-509(-)|eukprot:CAMPEP_0114250654 /NCGR_PEP_ID=MMETSP0058-20121206/14822_1 /TAXON_ID=36894 /ORGANISM="Pyramimonas parkeae, CCMP726" /LENGTH=104 /DNA_ID=CAMNT_0001364343 /DNA_START=47 /DNA_END=361 /DNA_ORIENTATION=-